MTVANASYESLLRTAAKTGCVGIEVRNDLAGNLFDGTDPAAAGQQARDMGLRILAVAEIKSFNHFTRDVLASLKDLVSIARACGAEGISLIPANDNSGCEANNRRANLSFALSQIKPVLEANDLIGFVEPLGFDSASLRFKHELVESIEALDACGQFKIVHDTFHHYLCAAHSDTIFPEHTGIVHISGVSDSALAPGELTDGHRVLVDQFDQLQNIQQLGALRTGGYSGPVSVEAFTLQVHQVTDPVAALTESFNYIVSEVNAVAAQARHA